MNGYTSEKNIRWVALARVTSLAEAGFLADLLDAEQLPSRVRQQDEFNALGGAWESVYILQTTPDASERAARLLLDAVSHDAGELETAEQVPRWSDDLPPARRGWLPVVLSLLASGLVVYAWRSPDRPPAAVHDEELTLWQAIVESNVPLVSERIAGQPTRRLHYDAAGRTVWLEEDLDGDGRSDRIRAFHR